MGLVEHRKEQRLIEKERRFNFFITFSILAIFTYVIWILATNGEKDVSFSMLNGKIGFSAFDYFYLHGFFHRILLFVRTFNLDVFKENINNVFPPSFFLSFKNAGQAYDIATAYKNYLIIAGGLFLFAFVFFWGVDFKNRLLKPVGYVLDMLFTYTLYPLERIVFQMVSDIKEDTLKSFHLLEREGFLKRIDRLINRSYEMTDGLERENTHYMAFYADAFFSDGKYDFETRYLMSCFKNRLDEQTKEQESEIEDLMRIYEAEIAKNNKPSNFDVYDEKEYFEDELKEYKAFQNNRVLFSPNAIKTFMNVETKNFEKFINAYLIYGRSYLTIQVAKLRAKIINSREWITDMLFAKDSYDVKYLKSFEIADNMLDEEYNELKSLLDSPNEWWELFYKKYLKHFLIAQYRFILFYSIMQRYCNMPVGLIVAKVQDYTTKMILDNYKMRAVLFLKPHVNDGTGNREQGARNDLLAQIFFYTFNYYEKLNGSIEDKINEKFDVLGMSLDEIEEQKDNESLFN